jgi:alanine racemase
VIRALARIDLGAVTRNCARLKEVVGPETALCAVVKADGYGHGDVKVALAALAGGATWLAVATAGEAARLRAVGIEAPVLVMGALSAAEMEIAVLAGADVVAWRTSFVERLAALKPDAGVHVKLDTGMGRLGTREVEEADAVVEAVLASPSMRLAGLMTHFATSDDDPEFALEQLGRFLPWAGAVKARHPEVLLHAANSAAALGIPGARLDMVRCGIAVYGMDPFQRDPAEHGLEPAMTLLSWVAEVKRCPAGSTAGYGRRFTAEADTWLATIPIGYADGVRRALTNNAEVLIGGRRFPLVGTVSMDNVTVDLGPGDAEPPVRGTEAVLIGAQGDDRILAEEVAARLQTINYEVTCGISPRVPRDHG